MAGDVDRRGAFLVGLLHGTGAGTPTPDRAAPCACSLDCTVVWRVRHGAGWDESLDPVGPDPLDAPAPRGDPVLLRQEVLGATAVLAVAGPVAAQDVVVLGRTVTQALAYAPRGVVVDLSEAGPLPPGTADVLRTVAPGPGCWPRPCVVVCGASGELARELPGAERTRADALAHVDDRGSGARARIEVRDGPAGPSRSRWAAVAWAVERGHAGLADDLAVVVSELVTNALRHGGPPVALEVEDVGDGVVVAVEDQSGRQPVPWDAGADDEHGRGLLLVDRLARETGVRPRPPGKTVWADLSDPGRPRR